MRMLRLFALLCVSLAVFACGDDDDQGDGSGPAGSNASPAPQPVTLDPSIEDALSCRVPPVRANPGGANGDLQRFDLTAFPLATCNDGSPAVLYFRPYEGEANKNKWVILLNGGGSCETAQDCANRWCGVDTNFDADNMSTANAGNSVPADGILERRPDNPFANYNHVQVRYCTSDSWGGRGLGVKLTAKDPKAGGDVTFEANFAGAYVFEAMLDTLRQDGLEPLVYARAKTSMPDLDEASEVVFGGGSAGGAGTITNLDRFAEALSRGSNKPVIRGYIEAVVGPDRSKFGFETTNGCKTAQLCDYEAAYKAVYAREQAEVGQHSWTDDSCIEWHEKNQKGTEWQCYDPNHVLANHVTTPFFVRTSLVDQLQAATAIESGLTGSDGTPLTILSYGMATAAYVRGLPQAVKSGHEGDDAKVLPGAFATSCRTHYTLFNTAITYGATISGDGGASLKFFDVWNNWVTGKGQSVLVSSAPRTDVCPGE